MSPIPTPVEFVGFGSVSVIDITSLTEAIDITGGGHVGSDNSPFAEYIPGRTDVEVLVEGDFGHREVGGLLYGKPGIFHKLHTRTNRGECTTLFSFQPTELPPMQKT